MFVRYGTFDFEPWEANLSVFAEFQRSRRGFKQLQNVRFDIRGDVCEDTGEYDVNTRLQEIVDAFSVDGQSCGLMHSDGTPTTHWMPNTATEPLNLSDVQVFSKRFPPTVDGEFASGRSFEIGVGSTYLNTTSNILEYKDALFRNGNAGPEFVWRKNPRWGYYPKLVSPTSLQQIVHTGHAVGAITWPPRAFPLYFPPYEDNTRRVVKQYSPDRHPAGYTSYRVEWTYYYTLPIFDDVSTPTVI